VGGLIGCEMGSSRGLVFVGYDHMIRIDLRDMQGSGSAVTGCVIGVVLVGREVAWIGIGWEDT